MTEPACTVVIPNWNGAAFLEPCLTALRAQTYRDFAVVLVDNRSIDGSLALVGDRFPEVELIELDENRGFAGAMNAGIRAAHSPYVAFLNNDTEADPRWLGELVACLERHPRAAAVTSKQVALDDPSRLDGAGDAMSWAFLPGPRGHGQPDSGQYEDEVEVFSASGTAALWRTDVLHELGLFDEDFFAYYEDVDLGFRARLARYECWYAPRAVVGHHRGGTAGDHVDFAYFHPVKNRWFMIVKNTPAPLFVRHLPHIVFGDAVWWSRAVRNGTWRALFRAYREVARSAGPLRRKRREVQARSRIGNEELELLLRPAQSSRRASDQ